MGVYMKSVPVFYIHCDNCNTQAVINTAYVSEEISTGAQAVNTLGWTYKNGKVYCNCCNTTKVTVKDR